MLQQTYQTNSTVFSQASGGAETQKDVVAPIGDRLTEALHLIQAMQSSPFWRLRGITIAVLNRFGLRQRTAAIELPRIDGATLSDVLAAHASGSPKREPIAANCPAYRRTAMEDSKLLQSQQRRKWEQISIVRRTRKLIAGVKALSDLPQVVSNLLGRIEQMEQLLGSRLGSEFDGRIKQMEQAVSNRLDSVEQAVSNRLGSELDQRLRTAMKAATTQWALVPPSRESQYYRGLNAVGVLNYEDDWLSGERRFLSLYLERNPEATVVDVGANVGHYCQMVRALAPHAKIYAIEPHPRNFEHLARISQEIGAEALLLALGEKAEKVRIFDYADDDGSQHASIYREVIERLHGRPATFHHVACRRLDDVADHLGVSSIGLLKIDAEGHELAVLKGAEKLIDAGAIDVIQFEFNEMNVISRTFFRDFLEYLTQYQFFRLLPDGVIKLSTYSPRFVEVFAFQNIVCIRNDLDAGWLESAR
jgi:FkbM family methyltransferase